MTVEADRVDPILQIQESLRGIVSRNSEMQVPSFTVNDEGDLPHGIETVATASGAGFWNHYIVGGQLTHTRLALEELQPTNVPRFQRNAIRLIREWQNSDNRNELTLYLVKLFRKPQLLLLGQIILIFFQYFLMQLGILQHTIID